MAIVIVFVLAENPEEIISEKRLLLLEFALIYFRSQKFINWLIIKEVTDMRQKTKHFEGEEAKFNMTACSLGLRCWFSLFSITVAP